MNVSDPTHRAPWRGIPLATEQEPLCLVVAPDSPRWRELGHRFAVRVREYSRVQPEERTPEALTEADWQRYHLILLGSILDNPAVLRLYARQLCYTDAAYPGRGGAEIRTLRNPLGTGRDVLLLGGSDFEAVHEAVLSLHRSFSRVTAWEEGTLFLRRLNFSASPNNCRWLPSPGEWTRIRDRIAQDPNAALALAADYALYQYQTDEERWTPILQELLEPLFEHPNPDPSALWHFAVGWNHVADHPAYPNAFREAVAAYLQSAGERLAERLTEETLPEREATAVLLGLHRIGQFLGRTGSRNPFQEASERLFAHFARNDPGVGSEGLRDWAVVDRWLSVLFEAEQYDLLEEKRLQELVQEILALTDNRPEPTIDRIDWEHAQNVLLKVAAFLDDGEPLWIRRWMRREAPEPLYSPDRPRWTWNWYTGPYVPDRLPEPPREVRQIFVAGGAHPRLIAVRADLDPLHEYLALWGPGLPLRRLTWRGVLWLLEHRWQEAPEGLSAVQTHELDEFCVLERIGPGYRQRLLWRVDHFLALWEEREPDQTTEWTATWTLPPEVASQPVAEGLYRLRQAGAELWVGVDRPDWSLWPKQSTQTVTALSPYRTTAEVRRSDGQLLLGPALCALEILKGERWTVWADLACAVGRRLWAFGFRRLRLETGEQLTASRPVDLSLDRRVGTGLLRVAEQTVLTWSTEAASESQTLEPGEYRSTFLPLRNSEEPEG